LAKYTASLQGIRRNGFLKKWGFSERTSGIVNAFSAKYEANTAMTEKSLICFRKRILWSNPISMTRMTVKKSPQNPWQYYSRSHRLSRPPMRPSGQDLAYYWDIAAEWVRKHRAPRVLQLGVTPELYDLPWPEGTDFLAVDRTQAMIGAIWPGSQDSVLCEDWLSMNLPDGSRDIVLCDGGLQLLDYPEGQSNLIRILRRVLSDEGLCIFRFYVLPVQGETPDSVIRDLLDGDIGSLETLKLRLNMSLQKYPEGGVVCEHVYETLVKAVPNLEELAVKLGWPVERMLLMNDYKGMEFRFYWLSLEQIVDLFCRHPGGFRVHRLETPSYELGQRCPTVALQCCSG